MTKFLFTILSLTFLVCSPAFSQREVSGDFFPGIKVEKNYLANPYFEKNLTATLGTTHSVSRNTSSPIQGVADLQIVAGAAGNTRITTLAWEKRLEGQNCELSFKYTGGGGTWTAQIWDGSLNVLVSRALPASTLVSPIQINYPCGAISGRTIRFVTTASASNLNVDEIYYGLATNVITVPSETDWTSYAGAWEASTTNPTLGNGVAVYEYRITRGQVQVRGSILRGSTTVAGTGTYRITAPPGFTFKTIPGQTSANYIIGKSNYYSNTTTTAAQVGSLIYQTADNKMVFSTDQNAIANGLSSGQTNVFNATGDILFWFGEYPVTGFSATQQAVTQQCIQDGSCENVFSAYTDAAGVVSLENVNWINGNPTLAASTFTYTFVSGFFSAAPNCSIASANGANLLANIVTVSSTGMTIRMFNPSNNANSTGVDFRVVCQRSGTDYKPRFAAPILTGSVTSNSNNALRIEAASITSAGVVTELGTSDWINGNCTNANPIVCTFVTNTFAATPVCQITRNGLTGAVDTPGIAAISASSISYSFHRNGTGEIQQPAHLTCTGVRLQ